MGGSGDQFQFHAIRETRQQLIERGYSPRAVDRELARIAEERQRARMQHMFCSCVRAKGTSEARRLGKDGV